MGRLLLLVIFSLLQYGYGLSSRAKKAVPNTEGDVMAQIEKLWQEVNSLKEMQALQTVCLRGVKAIKKCYLISDKLKHYHEANEDCIAQGGTLAIPRDSSENDILRDYIKRSLPGSKEFWIGVTDIVNEGKYVDVNSLPVTFFSWDRSKREPTGGKRESCVAISAQGMWSDEVCRGQKKYICEVLIP